MFELLVLVVASDKKALYLVFINEHIFPKLVPGPLFLSTTFSHGHSFSERGMISINNKPSLNITLGIITFALSNR